MAKRIKAGGGLYRNPGGSHWLYDFTFKGVRHCASTGHKNLTRARAWLAVYKGQLADSTVGIRPPCTMTVAELHTAWAKAMTGTLTQGTLDRAALRLRLHLTSIAHLVLPEVTKAKLEDLRTAYLAATSTAGRPHTPAGANKLVALVTTWLNWAISREDIELHALPFKIEALGMDETVKPVVWPEQVGPFLAEIRRRQRCADAGDLCQAQITLGVREDEALGARWEWVGWRNHVYTVGNSKTGKAREVPMMKSFEAILRARWTAAGEPAEGLIFPAEDGEPHRAGYTRKPVARGGRSLKIKGLHPHALRRTFATNHYEIGTPISQIQQMLGHKHQETTELYIVKRPKDQARHQRKAEIAMQLSRTSHAPKPKQISKAS
jgi:integrase